MVQLAFTRRILAAAKQMGLHTAIETSGFLGDRADDAVSVQSSISCCSTSRAAIPTPIARQRAASLAPTLRFAERLAAMGKPVWVRFTLVPGLTDDPANVEKVARFVAPMKNVEWVEVQPFHQIGAFKWKAHGPRLQARRTRRRRSPSVVRARARAVSQRRAAARADRSMVEEPD